MSKRTIDADALLAWVSSKHDSAVCSCERNFIFITKEKINELATLAPKPQEIIYDAKGWCFDMSTVPIDENILLLCESCLISEVVIARKPFKDAECQYSTENFCGCCTIMELAWRPLPPLPTPK